MKKIILGLTLLMSSLAANAATTDVVYYTPLSKPLPWLLSATCSDAKGINTQSALSFGVQTSTALAPGHVNLTVKTNVCVKFLGLQFVSLKFTDFPLQVALSLPLGKQGWMKLSDAEVRSLDSALSAQLSPVLIVTHDADAPIGREKFTLHMTDTTGAPAATISMYLQSKGRYRVPVKNGAGANDDIYPIVGVDALASGQSISGSVTAVFRSSAN